MKDFMSNTEITTVLAELKGDIQNEYRTELIGLFGSIARNEATDSSDVDLLVKCEKGTSLFDLARLKNFLEMKLQKKVDLVTEKGLRKEIAPYILKDIIFL